MDGKLVGTNDGAFEGILEGETDDLSVGHDDGGILGMVVGIVLLCTNIG